MCSGVPRTRAESGGFVHDKVWFLAFLLLASSAMARIGCKEFIDYAEV
jgi:hypothetical protein